MSKFTQNIKNFFQKKPVRIITAITIIAGIMTGIAFGLIAIIRAIKNPCASQPGTTFDTSINKCVPNNCDGELKACTTKGAPLYLQCPPTDYCDFSNSEMHFQYDPDSCECKPICNIGEQEAFNIDNKKTTILDNNKNPIDQFNCGYECEFSPNGFCEHPNTHKNCNISPLKDGQILRKGCNFTASASSYELCSDPSVICPLKGNEHIPGTSSYPTYSCKEGPVTIVNSSIPKLMGKTFTSYCSRTDKCGAHDPDMKIICASDNDCKRGDPKRRAKCKYDNSTLEGKGIHYLGYCSNSNDFYTDDDYCRNVHKIGEKKYNSGDQKSLEELLYTAKDNYDGISLNQPQCKSIDADQPKCLTNEIEGWYCGSINEISVITNSTVESLSESNPPVSMGETLDQWSSLNEFMCCDTNKVVRSDVGINYCCIKDAISNKCRNSSKYSPNQSWLEYTGPEENFNCSSHEDCDIFNKYLYSKLDKLSSSSSNGCTESLIEDSNNPCNSKMFCDLSSKHKKCKFYAGFIDKLDSSQQVSFNKFIIGDDDSTKRSIALPSLGINNIKWNAQPALLDNNDGNFMMCTAKSTGGAIFGKYKNNGNPESWSEESQYTSKIVWEGNAPDSIDPLTLNLECIRKGRSNGIYTTEVAKSSLDENRIDINNNVTNVSESETEFTCIMDANCINSKSTVKTGKGPTSYGSLKWNFGPTDYPANGILDSDGHKVLLTADSGAGDICTNFNTQSACEKKTIPTAWANKPDEFGSLCYWDPNALPTNKCNSSCSNTDLYKRPKYKLRTGEYSKTGWGADGNIGSITPC